MAAFTHGEITIALAAWRSGKTVLSPKVVWELRQMVPTEIHSLEEGLVRTRQGLREPAEGRQWPDEDIDLIVVPALAYDRSGNRLGRGGGFYDRFLARPGLRATTCGLAFDEQLVDSVPVHTKDYPIDVLVTDRGVLRFSHHRQAVAGTDPLEE